MDIAKIKATGFDLTPAISEYVEKKIGHLEKFLASIPQPQKAFVEVQRTTQHHNKGNVYRAEVMLEVPGKTLRAEAVADELYAAIDAVKDALERQIVKYKESR